MGFRGDGRQGEFGEGFGDADDGFELADCDGDAGAGVGGYLGGVHLPADGNEVGREFFAGFGGEAGRATSGVMRLSALVWDGREVWLTICSS